MPSALKVPAGLSTMADEAVECGGVNFMSLFGAAATVWPLTGRAQPAKLPTVGALVLGSTDPEQFWREFRQGLRDLGYVEGQNIRFEFRSAQGQIDRLPALAGELVRLKVDVHRDLVHAPHGGGKASNARNPDRDGRHG